MKHTNGSALSSFCQPQRLKRHLNALPKTIRSTDGIRVSRMHRLLVHLQYEMNMPSGIIHYDFHQTPLSEVLIATNSTALCALRLTCKQTRAAQLAVVATQWPSYTLIQSQSQTKPIADALFAEHKQNQPLLHVGVQLGRGTSLQKALWCKLLSIPEGQLVSYQTLAQAVGHSQASRAVGSAVGANPISLLLPCHRVIRASGHLGGYLWGLDVKQALLTRELAKAPTLS